MPSLRRRSDFQELKQKGHFFHVNGWLAISYRKNDQNRLRWAWTLPKKMGKAVVRNRMKRWGREFLSGFHEKNVDINFIFRVKEPDFYEKLNRKTFDQSFHKVFKDKVS